MAVGTSEQDLWRTASETQGLRDPEVKSLASFEEWGRCKRTRNSLAIEKSPDKQRFRTFARIPYATPLTTNWGLIDAVQRLGWRDRSTPPITFNILHNLDSLRRDQQLGFLESFEARFGEREVTLHGYYQIGEGTMPIFYWVNDDNCLVLARYGMAALVYTTKRSKL